MGPFGPELAQEWKPKDAQGHRQNTDVSAHACKDPEQSPIRFGRFGGDRHFFQKGKAVGGKQLDFVRIAFNPVEWNSDLRLLETFEMTIRAKLCLPKRLIDRDQSHIDG